MKQLDILNFNNQEVRKVIDNNNDTWFVAKDVCRILQIRNVSDAVGRISNKMKTKIQILDLLGRANSLLLLNEQGLKILVGKSNKPNAKLLAVDLGLIVHNVTIESNHISILKESFKRYVSIDQYYVEGYHIDLYFPELNLAIECDEHAHKYKKKADIARQNKIKKALNCEFIRLRPEEPNFNIGETISEIIEFIFNKN
jgi:very-short-patch-repair endonuclease